MAKKIICLTLVIVFSFSFLTSCQETEVKETSVAGAYFLMFRELAETRVNVGAYLYLSFDKESTGLKGEDLEKLEALIKAYCTEKDVSYLDMDMTRLERALKITTGSKGREFKNGYLLTYDNCETYEEEDGSISFTGSVSLWHGDFDAVGGLEFMIGKTNKGWYIKRDLENGGYDILLS